MENDTIKRRKLAWKNVTSNIQDLLLPLLKSTNTEQKPLLELPSVDSINDIVFTPHQGERIHEINSSTRSSEGSNSLSHAIKAYANRHSTEKKVI